MPLPGLGTSAQPEGVAGPALLSPGRPAPHRPQLPTGWLDPSPTQRLRPGPQSPQLGRPVPAHLRGVLRARGPRGGGPPGSGAWRPGATAPPSPALPFQTRVVGPTARPAA